MCIDLPAHAELVCKVCNSGHLQIPRNRIYSINNQIYCIFWKMQEIIKTLDWHRLRTTCYLHAKLVIHAFCRS